MADVRLLYKDTNMEFASIPNGIDILIDGVLHKKTRAWGVEQFNASLMENRDDLPTFIKVSDGKQVALFRELPNFRLN